MSRLLPLLLVLLVALPAMARAQVTTLAVPPLSRAAASEQYDGLGRALAGMILSDLSGVASLQLVERDRLDALLSEIELGETGYLDPSTAQRLGRGLGAELVLAGSYSVVDGTFALDGRLVHVESGQVIRASASHGPVEDWVVVEKELVEALLEDLEVELGAAARRRLLLQAPTERFEAFTAYGEGLERKREGRADEARQAFERALQLDPEFALARAALGEIRALLERERSTAEARLDDALAQVHARILAEVSADADLPADHAYTSGSQALWALRLRALAEQGRHCERYQDMLHFLDRHDWVVEEPPRGDAVGVLGYEINQAAEAFGYSDLPPGRIDRTWTHLGIWRGLVNFVFDNEIQRTHEREGGAGLIGALTRCFPPGEQAAELERLRSHIHRVAPERLQEVRRHRAALTLGEKLELMWARRQAEHFGADEALHRRLEALLEGRSEDDRLRLELRRQLEHVLALAEEQEASQMRQGGRSPDQIRTKIGALVEADEAVFDPAPRYCSALQHYERPILEPMVTALAADPPTRVDLDQAGLRIQMFAAAGCLQGAEPRFDGFEDLLGQLRAEVEAALQQEGLTERCRGAWQRLHGRLEIFRGPTLEGTLANRASEDINARTLLMDYYAHGPVAAGCLPAP